MMLETTKLKLRNFRLGKKLSQKTKEKLSQQKLGEKNPIEHKIPLSRSGTNARDNLDIACRKCNYHKNKKTEKEYREEICKKIIGK